MSFENELVMPLQHVYKVSMRQHEGEALPPDQNMAAHATMLVISVKLLIGITMQFLNDMLETPGPCATP